MAYFPPLFCHAIITRLLRHILRHEPRHYTFRLHIDADYYRHTFSPYNTFPDAHISSPHSFIIDSDTLIFRHYSAIFSSSCRHMIRWHAADAAIRLMLRRDALLRRRRAYHATVDRLRWRFADAD